MVEELKKVVLEELLKDDLLELHLEDKEDFYKRLDQLADEWVDYAKEKGWGEENLREAIALLIRDVRTLPGTPKNYKIYNFYNPSAYELYLKLQNLGLDKTDAFHFAESLEEWKELVEMVESGFTPEEIDVVKGYGQYGYVKYGYVILSGYFEGYFDDFPFFNDKVFEEVVRELEKEHGLDEESSWKFVKEYDREILDSIDEVKFVKWKDYYAYYCKNEDLPKVKERFKEEIARRLEANPELGR